MPASISVLWPKVYAHCQVCVSQFQSALMPASISALRPRVYAHCQVRVCVSVSAFVPMCTLVVVYGCLYECMCMPLSVRESIRGEQHMQYCWHLISLRIQVRLAKAVYMHTVYDRIFCDFSAGILYRFTPYVYGSGHVQLTSLFELKHAHTRTHIYTHTYAHTHSYTHIHTRHSCARRPSLVAAEK